MFDLGVPVLGICYGVQLFADMLDGKVEKRVQKRSMVSRTSTITITPVFSTASTRTRQVWMSHGDSITKLPKGFTTIGTTENCPFARVVDVPRKFYGVQFHPEVVHTPQGTRVLSNFVHRICGRIRVGQCSRT